MLGLFRMGLSDCDQLRDEITLKTRDIKLQLSLLYGERRVRPELIELVLRRAIGIPFRSIRMKSLLGSLSHCRSRRHFFSLTLPSALRMASMYWETVIRSR